MNYNVPGELALGKQLNCRVPKADQKRQRTEVKEILRRLRNQPGVILADEVGMGKTYVALGVAYSVAIRSPRGPVIVMVPANLVGKWEQDLKTFCELYLLNRHPVKKEIAVPKEELLAASALRYGVARHSVDLMKLLDDPPQERCQLIFLAQGAMGRRQTDKWVRLALIAEALRRHARGQAGRLIKVRNQIHRFLAELLRAIGEESAHDWGEGLWQELLHADPSTWKHIYNQAVRAEHRQLFDDPVPKSVRRALQRIELKPLANALQEMPIQAHGGEERVSERLAAVRQTLKQVEQALWKRLLAQTRWRSPLLVMDEAHHLKNPATLLARQLQSPDVEQDLRTGDGAMARAFDRMLFLTATPFQLGHHELVSVLERFGDVRWEASELGDHDSFDQKMGDLSNRLDESQRTAIALQRTWSRLRLEDCNGDVEAWWADLRKKTREQLTHRQRAVVDAFQAAKRSRDVAEKALYPWILRYNKGDYWTNTEIPRRQRVDGACITTGNRSEGLPVPPHQLLTFFLAARSAVRPGQDLLGEALCSSYEAFRLTRKARKVEKDEQEVLGDTLVELSESGWYLREFDLALEQCSGSTHPKVEVTARKAVDLWEAGEKVLVFAYYRQTCRALRIHISREIEKRTSQVGLQKLSESGREAEVDELDQLIGRIQKRYFDDADAPGRKAIDAALKEILNKPELKKAFAEQQEVLMDVMRRFLRVGTTLVRCFPLAELDNIEPATAAKQMLGYADSSDISWRDKFESFVEFLLDRCSTDEFNLYLEAARQIQTGGILVGRGEDNDEHTDAETVTLANVQVATGTTKRDARARLMLAFNTPFFPDILVCSEVMGEGVDLQRFCRHVIHHDLAWNPSSIEQRTGRIDRIGCKAEGKNPILVYLPYLAGTADERQYRVMSDREQWFRVVMGQDAVARLITPDYSSVVPLPKAVSNELSFKLDVGKTSP